MTLELNQVLIAGETQTFSLIAESGKLTSIRGGMAERQTRWLLAMMGLEPVRQGYVSIDGEPLTALTAPLFRQLMAYSPRQLVTAGTVNSYEPPSVQDIFLLRANRDLPISNGILGEEMRRIAAGANDDSVRLLAVAALLNKPIMLVESPIAAAADYLKQLAAKGSVVVVTTDRPEILAASDNIVELS